MQTETPFVETTDEKETYKYTKRKENSKKCDARDKSE
jgi:hypothetical protein